MFATTRRALAAGVVAGALAGMVAGVVGVGVAHASTPVPGPITVDLTFSGAATDASEAGAETRAIAAAEANEAQFTERTGATCTDTATDVESRNVGNVFVAVARVTASCTIPIPVTP